MEYQILFIISSGDGHLGYLNYLAIKTNAALKKKRISPFVIKIK